MNVESLRAQHSVSAERSIPAPANARPVDAGGRPDQAAPSSRAANGNGSTADPPSARFGFKYDVTLDHLFIELRDPVTGNVTKTPPEYVVRLFNQLKDSAGRSKAEDTAAQNKHEASSPADTPRDNQRQPVRLLATA